ncbi:MAG: glutaminase [Odoribacter sp.]|nr:glutaminase [Odoribacter sp.]
MIRKLSFEDVKKAVKDAYENNKNINDGNPDARIKADPALFGISVVLTDGRKAEAGDSSVAAPIGEIAKIPTSVVLLSQNKPDELVKKSGTGQCHCGRGPKPEIPVSRHGIRAVSAIVPQGDADGKWNIMIDNFINLAGSAPVLDDSLYSALKAEVSAANTENVLASAEFTLYDDAATSIDLYTRLLALKATTEQLATLGATIAADGRNPINGEVVFDGSVAASVITLAAVKGPRKETRAWLMRTGLPAKSGMGGMILAILPGFGAIAAYSPALDCNGTSVKAAKAIEEISAKLGLNVFASARVEVE